MTWGRLLGLSGAVASHPVCVRVFRAHMCRINVQGHVYCSALLLNPTKPFVPAGTKPWLRPAFPGTETHGEMEHNGLPLVPEAEAHYAVEKSQEETFLLLFSLARVCEASEHRNPAQDGPRGAPIQPWVCREGADPEGLTQRPGPPLAAPWCGHLLTWGSLTSQTGEESRRRHGSG